MGIGRVTDKLETFRRNLKGCVLAAFGNDGFADCSNCDII